MLRTHRSGTDKDSRRTRGRAYDDGYSVLLSLQVRYPLQQFVLSSIDTILIPATWNHSSQNILNIIRRSCNATHSKTSILEQEINRSIYAPVGILMLFHATPTRSLPILALATATFSIPPYEEHFSFESYSRTQVKIFEHFVEDVRYIAPTRVSMEKPF